MMLQQFYQIFMRVGGRGGRYTSSHLKETERVLFVDDIISVAIRGKGGKRNHGITLVVLISYYI